MRHWTIALGFVALAAACASSTPPRGNDDSAPSSVADNKREVGTQAPTPPRSASKVIIRPPGRAALQVSVEVVQSPREIQRGMMYRRYLAPEAGMLFLMGEERVQTFWMRNTLISLDMIFIGQDKRVVGIVERATPLTDTQRTIGKPSMYVLEVNGGYAAAHGLGPGDAVDFIAIQEQTDRPAE